MSKIPLLSALALALSLVATRAQAPGPLTEGDLLKGIDALNADPLNTKPLLEKPPGKKEKTEGQTEITADAAEFNNKTHIAIFIGNVIVKNPEFNVVCDKLTAYLKHDEMPAPASGGKLKNAVPAPGSAAAPKSKGGLEKAVAEMANGGKVVITQEKKEADGSSSTSVGKGEKAVYNAVTGVVTLTGWPEARQGPNTSVAVEEGTVMIMTRDGNMRTEKGRTKFIIQGDGNDKPAKP